ncbi:MAG: hypothetical protein WCJ07_10395, partial [Verrucomicrobiota bacterium]
HDFNEREARLTEVFGLFHMLSFIFSGVNNVLGRLDDCYLVHFIAKHSRYYAYYHSRMVAKY